MINLFSFHAVFKDLSECSESIQLELEQEFINLYEDMLVDFDRYKTRLTRLLRFKRLLKSTQYECGNFEEKEEEEAEKLLYMLRREIWKAEELKEELENRHTKEERYQGKTKESED